VLRLPNIAAASLCALVIDATAELEGGVLIEVVAMSYDSLNATVVMKSSRVHPYTIAFKKP